MTSVSAHLDLMSLEQTKLRVRRYLGVWTYSRCVREAFSSLAAHSPDRDPQSPIHDSRFCGASIRKQRRMALTILFRRVSGYFGSLSIAFVCLFGYPIIWASGCLACWVFGRLPACTYLGIWLLV
ncbi:hypothetical protein BOTBODRAFT_36584 [Botryobasidium botryosum FD-172 SS1]|uniref:Uncharacterized protein n=1 Tax=Botryobasidium botryosum (strain FD-172 SS1) TaxID=930990 RepID=A0A067M5H7_BOTB1|nr:hypothetical protein BOTBODRAFT_36584 [Botryobasidium botryosum FD-172 SS1]